MSLGFEADARFAAGIHALERGEFFEAHEIWEGLWLELTGAEREFLGALIQMAAGLHHQQGGNRNGARRLLTRSRARLEASPLRPTTLNIAPWLARALSFNA